MSKDYVHCKTPKQLITRCIGFLINLKCTAFINFQEQDTKAFEQVGEKKEETTKGEGTGEPCPSRLFVLPNSLLEEDCVGEPTICQRYHLPHFGKHVKRFSMLLPSYKTE